MKHFIRALLLMSALTLAVSAQIPELLSPSQDDVLDNGCEDQSDNVIWEFSWSGVEGADRYHIYVQRLGAQFPVLNHAVTDTSYKKKSKGYIAPQNADGWTWRVRAQVRGKWGKWSAVRTFSVEPIDTDCA